ncbi:MAG TPA: sigma-70 family RNA polymerase sigma factor [Lacipirellulaceae bacterium]|nr:sigma-70 family RNA polymerase sigma factor [Lacipirellulaceae bacterium]
MTNRDEVALQLIEVQSRLSGYIYTLVLDRELTKDLLQRTNVVVLEKQDAFAPGTNFFAWVCRIAYHEVLAARRDRLRDRHLFDEGLMEMVAAESEDAFQRQDERLDALFSCLAALSDDQRQLIMQRYAPGGSVARLAGARHKPPAAISSLLTRIRWRLVDCIDRKTKGQYSR